jgi:signal peptidase I
MSNSEEKEVKQAEAAPEQTGPPKGILREYFESLVATLVMAIFGMTFVLQAVTVPTGSMENTIMVGDYLLVNKFIYGAGEPAWFLPQRKIERGDIIVFKYPGNSVDPLSDLENDPPLLKYQLNYVKRVVGLPGETIEFRGGQVFINGSPLPETRLQGDHPDGNQRAPLMVQEFEPSVASAPYQVYYNKTSVEDIKAKAVPRKDYAFAASGKPTKIPDDSYFVMGDNRDNSADSRYWGFVKRDLVIGRAMFVYWSCDLSKNASAINCLTGPRLNRIGKMIK